MYKMDKEILGIIKDLNLKLHKEFCKNSVDEIYTPTMLDFLNDLDGLSVKFFSSVEEINNWLSSVEEMEAFLDFYHSLEGVIDSSLLVEQDGRISFVVPGGFYDFVNHILRTLDDEEVVSFNQYIMGKLVKYDFR